MNSDFVFSEHKDFPVHVTVLLVPASRLSFKGFDLGVSLVRSPTQNNIVTCCSAGNASAARAKSTLLGANLHLI